MVPKVKDKRSASISLLVFAFGAAVTFFAFTSIRTAEKAVLDIKFSQAAQQGVFLIKNEISHNLESLRSLATYIASVETLDRERFKVFTQEITRSNPSYQSLAWVPIVSLQQRNEFEKSAQKEGYTSFQISEKNDQNKLIRAEIREEYFPVLFVEPMGGNFRAIGFDLGSEAQRKTALVSARKTKSHAVTPFIVLVQEAGHQKANLFIDPVFRKQPIINPESKQSDGFVVLAIRSIDLLNSAIGDFSENIQFLIEEKPSFDNTPTHEQYQKLPIDSRYHRAVIQVADRIWQVTVTPAPKFHQQNALDPSPFFLVFGLILSTFLSFHIWKLLIRKYQLAEALEEKSRKLHASEERFSLTAEDSFVGIWERPNMENDHEYWSPSFYTLLGYNTGEIPSSNASFKKMLHPDDHEHVNSLQKEHFEKKTTYELEYRLQTKKQGYRWFRSSGQTTRDENDIPLRMIGIIQDIHEEKTATARLMELLNMQRRASSQLEALLKVVGDAIVIIDENGIILHFSPSAEKMFGYEQKEILGQNVKRLMPSQYSKKHDSFLQAYLKTRFRVLIGSTRELEGKRNGGNVFPIQLKIEEIKGAEKNYVGIIHDLSEAKQSEQKRFDEKMELVRANKELEYLNCLANYDLEDLLINLNNFIRQSTMTPQEQKSQSETFFLQFQFLNIRVELLNKFFSRRGQYTFTDHPDVETERVDLNKLVQEVADSLDEDDFTIHIKPLPALDVSAVELNILFRNIFETIIKHRDNEKGNITVSCREQKEQYEFSIEYDGSGMQQDVKEKIFSHVHISLLRDTMDRSDIGLAFVKKIVDVNKGNITVSPREKDQRATITIQWPRTTNKS
ncbi:MAG: PAS domain S-box protein [Sneathiella sp.]|nr:PAS domain S-box protein [Sneathiella sp.]